MNLSKGSYKKLFLAALLFVSVTTASIASMFYYSSLMSQCEVSNVLQAKMKTKLSKTELMSVRKDNETCPTMFVYTQDDGSSGCVIGSENIFRGPEIIFGSCG